MWQDKLEFFVPDDPDAFVGIAIITPTITFIFAVLVIGAKSLWLQSLAGFEFFMEFWMHSIGVVLVCFGLYLFLFAVGSVLCAVHDAPIILYKLYKNRKMIEKYC